MNQTLTPTSGTQTTNNTLSTSGTSTATSTSAPTSGSPTTTATKSNKYGPNNPYPVSPDYVMNPVSKVTYQYDAAGNRVSMNADGQVTNYSYNSTNEVTKAGSTQYSYDANGNMIAQKTSQGTVTYGYTGDNQMNKVSYPDGTGVTYKYDALRRMSQRTETNYTTAPGNGVGNAYGSNGQPMAEYYEGANGIIAQQMFGLHNQLQDSYMGNIQTRGGLMYYEYDGLGNVMDITDRTGAQTMAYRYDAYGNLFTQMAAPYNDLGYTGAMYDAKAGLLNLSARWYNPGTGSFTTQDTYSGSQTNPMSLNLYAYAQDNPVNMTDPTGHNPTLTWAKDGIYPTNPTTVKYVKILQQDLNTLGFAKPLLVKDGQFGPKTEGAVVAFQKAYGLYGREQGKVTNLTWNKIYAVKQERAAGQGPQKLLSYGSTGSAVRTLQQDLNRLGGYHLTRDGIFGQQTLEAVRQFQKRRGLSVDGIVGNQTWEALLNRGTLLPSSVMFGESPQQSFSNATNYLAPDLTNGTFVSILNAEALNSLIQNIRQFGASNRFTTTGVEAVVSTRRTNLENGYVESIQGFHAEGNNLATDVSMIAAAYKKQGGNPSTLGFTPEVSAQFGKTQVSIGASGDWGIQVSEPTNSNLLNGIGGKLQRANQYESTHTILNPIGNGVDMFNTTVIVGNDRKPPRGRLPVPINISGHVTTNVSQLEYFIGTGVIGAIAWGSYARGRARL